MAVLLGGRVDADIRLDAGLVDQSSSEVPGVVPTCFNRLVHGSRSIHTFSRFKGFIGGEWG